MFTYGPNENVSTFVNASFEPMFVDEIVWADNETQAAAEAQCGGDVVCLFDAASTNDVTIGLNSQEVNVMVEEENKRLSKTSIDCRIEFRGQAWVSVTSLPESIPISQMASENSVINRNH